MTFIARTSRCTAKKPIMALLQHRYGAGIGKTLRGVGLRFSVAAVGGCSKRGRPG